MQFGMSQSPYRRHGDASRSPVPEPQESNRSTWTRSSPQSRSRDLRKDRKRRQDGSPPQTKQPMRFSLSYCSSPLPSVHHTSSVRISSVSPVPREVNTTTTRKNARSHNVRGAEDSPLERTERSIHGTPPLRKRVRKENGVKSATKELRSSSAHPGESHTTVKELAGIASVLEYEARPPAAWTRESLVVLPEPQLSTPQRQSEFSLPQFTPSREAMKKMRLATPPQPSLCNAEFSRPRPVASHSVDVDTVPVFTSLLNCLSPTPAEVPVPTESYAEVTSLTPRSPPKGNGSPVPTTDNLIYSVSIASAEKRPCGCTRPSPTSNSAVRHHGTRTMSPQPVPALHSPNHDRCPGPSPHSLSSKQSEAAAVAPPPYSPSPWPTTENIINSIKVLGEQKRRGDAECTEEQDSNESLLFVPRVQRVSSPHLTPTHVLHSMQASVDKARRHLASPCGESRASPTSVALEKELTHGSCTHRSPYGSGGDRTRQRPPDDSGSPQPTADRLIESLEVTAENTRRMGEPALSRTNTDVGVDDGVAPSPAPTRCDLESSTLAATDKRGKQQAQSTFYGASSTVTQSHITVSMQVLQPSTVPDRSTAREPHRSSDGVHVHLSLSTEEAEAFKDSTLDTAFTCLRRSTPLSPQTKSSSTGTAASVEENRTVATTVNNRVAVLSPLPSREGSDDSTSLNSAAKTYDLSPVSDESAVAPLESFSNQLSKSQSTSSEDDAAEGSQEDQQQLKECLGCGRATPIIQEETDAPDDIPSEGQQPSEAPTASQALSMPSEVFKPCISAPPTPAMPYLPEKFLELQRDVKAISEGRSRTSARINSPRCSISALPLELPPRHSVDAAAGAVEVPTTVDSLPYKEMDATRARRCSLILVNGAAGVGYRPVIQEPHMPLPDPLVASPMVSIPRVSPPPRGPAVKADKATDPVSFAMFPDSESASVAGNPPSLSPLPRPVLLMSQVGGAAKAFLSNPPAVVPGVLENPAPQGMPNVSSSAPLSLTPREGRSTPYPRGSHVLATKNEMDISDDAWSLDNQTIVVSAEGSCVVRTLHLPANYGKRSRGDATPEKVVEPPGTAEKSVACEPKMRLSSGRRSTVERLIDMLPPDVVDEVIGGRSDTMESSQSMLSLRHSGDSCTIGNSDATEGRPSIVQRVPQRPRTADYDHNYGMRHLDEVAQISTRKYSKSANKRNRQKIKNEMTSNPEQSGAQENHIPQKSHRPTRSSPGQGSGSPPVSSESLAPPSVTSPVVAKREFRLVSTRLSEELKKAVFLQSPVESTVYYTLPEAETSAPVRTKKKRDRDNGVNLSRTSQEVIQNSLPLADPLFETVSTKLRKKKHKLSPKIMNTLALTKRPRKKK